MRWVAIFIAPVFFRCILWRWGLFRSALGKLKVVRERLCSVCYQLAMVQIFNSVLFNMGCPEKKKNKNHLTAPAFSAKQQGCGIFRTYSGRFKELDLGPSVILQTKKYSAGIIKRVLYCLVWSVKPVIYTPLDLFIQVPFLLSAQGLA